MPFFLVVPAAPVRRFLLGAVLLVCAGAGHAATPAPLTDIREIRALSPEQAAEKLPVKVRGVITRLTPHELFVQDGPDAIFVGRNDHDPALRMGDYIEVRGFTDSGHFFPIIIDGRLTVLDHRALPVPQILRPGELASARGDCQWVEIVGTVQTAETRLGGTLSLRILYEDSLVRAEITESVERGVEQLIGARVRLRGVVSGLKTPQRTLIEPVLWAAWRPDTVMIESPGPDDLFTMPFRTLAVLHGHNAVVRRGELVRIAATVTSQPTPQLVFVRDGGRCLEIHLQAPAPFVPGDRIEAVGFPEMGLVQNVLRNAVARRVAAAAPPDPLRLRATQLLDFRHEAELVEVTAELREIFRHPGGLTLLLNDEGMALNVDVGATQIPVDAVLPPVGSRVSLVGTCAIERVTPPDNFQIVAPAAVRLRLRSLDDLHVLARPPWWTPRRLAAAVAGLSLFGLGAVGWIWTLNRRVQAQTHIILGNAQRSAVLEERNRIAREFHDTVEQQLAGATILLDAVDTVVEQPQRARAVLATARAMLRHSLDEAQQAVADLRNNDLIERDLGSLIEDAVRERLRGTSIAAEFRRAGAWPDLDTMVKQHLLRMIQESVTNAAKHASARRVTVAWRAETDQAELTVTDDGSGFDVAERARGGSGRFGLIGLQERAGKIGARLAIESQQGRGTTIAIRLALPTVAAI